MTPLDGGLPVDGHRGDFLLRRGEFFVDRADVSTVWYIFYLEFCWQSRSSLQTGLARSTE